MLHILEPDKCFVLFIPQPEPQRLQAGPERNRRRHLERRGCLMRLLQIIIRDLGTQMVDVMEPDISGYPLQRLGQLIIRASSTAAFT